MQSHHVTLTADLTLPWKHLLNSWWSPLARWLRPYRPEKHYMRGPGPKCREKNVIAFELQANNSIGRTSRQAARSKHLLPNRDFTISAHSGVGSL
jgi:hypothetical protein